MVSSVYPARPSTKVLQIGGSHLYERLLFLGCFAFGGIPDFSDIADLVSWGVELWVGSVVRVAWRVSPALP